MERIFGKNLVMIYEMRIDGKYLELGPTMASLLTTNWRHDELSLSWVLL